MAKQSTFRVSQKGVAPVTVNFNEPESVNDPRWDELLGPGQDRNAVINELAVQSLVIKLQSTGRGKLSEGQAAVQAAIDAYRYGVRTGGGGGARKVKLGAEQIASAGFSEEQLAMLRAAGVVVEGMDSSDEPETGDDPEGGEEDTETED